MIDIQIKKNLKNYLKSLIEKEKNRIKIISVYSLSKEEIEKLTKFFSKSSAEIENIIDPSIIGGMIIQQGSKIIDLSIKNRLKNIEKKYGNY